VLWIVHASTFSRRRLRATVAAGYFHP
jgi:hypothetical protein